MRDERTKVVFRVWKHAPFVGDVIALFPQIPADVFRDYCQSYEHIGQHGSADYYLVIAHTRPAKPEEYRDLLAELEKIGYDNLVVVSRATRKDAEIRRDQIDSEIEAVANCGYGVKGKGGTQCF